MRAYRKSVIAVASVVVGLTAAHAEPQPAPVRTAERAPARVAVLPLSQTAAQPTRRARLETDALRADVRWPYLRECMDTTSTPEAFRACLHDVFGDEMSDARARP